MVRAVDNNGRVHGSTLNTQQKQFKKKRAARELGRLHPD